MNLLYHQRLPTKPILVKAGVKFLKLYNYIDDYEKSSVLLDILGKVNSESFYTIKDYPQSQYW